MPREALADTIMRWERLIGGFEEETADLEYLAPHREELMAALARARELKARHEAVRAEALTLARQLHETLEQGKESERRLRSGLKSVHGLHGTDLLRYGVQPRRPWRRRKEEGGAGPGE